MTANNASDNNIEHCRLILLLLRRFPQAIQTHSPRLLETLIVGITAKPPTANHQQFRDMLINEALPLVAQKPPEQLPSALVNRIMAFGFEHYVQLMFKEDDNPDRLTAISEHWRHLFDLLSLCGRMLKWELPFIGVYNRATSKDTYWQRLIQIVSSAPPRPSENKQILFCATITFTISLQEYIETIIAADGGGGGAGKDYILVEGFRAENHRSAEKKAETSGALDSSAPYISVFTPCTPETPVCLVTAAQCWQLLHSNDILKIDFSQLLMTVPMSAWINRFLIDLAVYLGRSDEAHQLLAKESAGMLRSLRFMSLGALGNFNVSPFCHFVFIFYIIILIFVNGPQTSWAGCTRS